jgi:hypothetical protein
MLVRLSERGGFVLRYDDFEWQYEEPGRDRIVGDDLRWVLESALDVDAHATS